MAKYAYDVNVLGTGSSGNCIVIDESFMIDCGLNFKVTKDYLSTVSAVFITHEHGDHLNIAALKNIAKTRPALIENRLFVNESTLKRLENKGGEFVAKMVSPKNIIDENWEREIKLGGREYHVRTYPLYHDVQNQGFVFTNDRNETLIHATDTQSMRDAPAGLYDFLLVEGNWDEDKTLEMMSSHDAGERFRALRNMRHLSVQAFERFVRSHSHENSKILQLHESMELGARSLINTDFTEEDLKDHLENE